MKISTGCWEELWAPTPLNQWYKVFAGADKAPKQVATEVATKGLGAKAEANLSGAGAVTLARREGVVLVAMTPLALVLPQADSSISFRWNDVLVAQLGLQKEIIIATYEGQAATAGAASNRNIKAKVDAVAWCP